MTTLYLDNKYTAIYWRLIAKARAACRRKNKQVYYENHHIIPKSLGGDNGTNNLVLLTAKEHYLCHLLLVKMTSGKPLYRMKSALDRLQTANISKGLLRQTARRYARDRERCVRRGHEHPMFGVPSPQTATRNKQRTGWKHTSETRQRMAETRKGKHKGQDNPMFGKRLSEKTKQIISEKLSGSNNPMYGKKHTNATKAKTSGKNHWLFGKKHTDESRRKMSDALKGKLVGELNGMFGKHHSEESKRHKSEAMKGRIWIYNPVEQRCLRVYPKEASLFYEQGWIKGRLPKI